VSTVFAAIGRFAVRFRWPVVAAWIIIALAVMAFLPSLNNQIQTNNESFLPASAPSVRAASLAAPFGMNDLQPVPVIAARSGTHLTPADVTAVAALQGRLRTVPGVASVRDLGRSPDGQAEELLVLARVGGGMMSNQTTTLVDALRAKISPGALPSGLQVHLAGDLAGQVDSDAASNSTGNSILNIAAVFIVVLLMVIFRSLLAPLLTLAPAFVSVTVSSGLVAEAAQHGLKVSSMAQLLLIVLVLGAGTDYGLFLVFRTREELRTGLTPQAAVARALGRVGESITFSAATVIGALLSLLAATFVLYSDMALPLAIGIGVMLVAGLTLLPALLAIFGRAAFWPGKTREGAGRTGLWGKVAARIVRRPALTLAAGVIVFGLLAAASFGYKGGGFGGQSTGPAGSDSAAGNTQLAAHFPAATADPTNVVLRLPGPAWQPRQAAALAAATGQLRANRLLRGVTGPLDPAGASLTPAQYAALHASLGPAGSLPAAPGPGPAGALPARAALYEAYRATANYVSPDGRVVLFDVGLAAGDPQSTAAMNTIPALRVDIAAVARSIGATDWGVAGQAPALYDVSTTSSADLARVIPLAIAVIGVLLALVMRSLVAPWYLIASVGLSYLAALGLSVLVFIDIRGASGLDFILPFLMFLFLLALGEDYNILVMTRIREEARHLPLGEAITRALNATGTTVTSAGLVLAGTFAVFAIVGGRGSGGSMVIDVGTGIALGILMDTFLVRTLLVPSTVALLGRWNWWPSRLGRGPGRGLGLGRRGAAAGERAELEKITEPG
jgi:putative drug exporter of the RND superfamily